MKTFTRSSWGLSTETLLVTGKAIECPILNYVPHLVHPRVLIPPGKTWWSRIRLWGSWLAVTKRQRCKGPTTPTSEQRQGFSSITSSSPPPPPDPRLLMATPSHASYHRILKRSLHVQPICANRVFAQTFWQCRVLLRACANCLREIKTVWYFCASSQCLRRLSTCLHKQTSVLLGVDTMWLCQLSLFVVRLITLCLPKRLPKNDSF